MAAQPDKKKQFQTQAPPTISRQQYLASLTPSQREANVQQAQQLQQFIADRNTQQQPQSYVQTGRDIGVLPQPRQAAPQQQAQQQAQPSREQQMVQQLTGQQPQAQPLSYVQAGQQAGVLPQFQQPLPEPSVFEKVSAALRSPFEPSQRTPEAIQQDIQARGQLPQPKGLRESLPELGEAAFMAAPLPAGALRKAAVKIPGWIPQLGRVISPAEKKGLAAAVRAGRADIPKLINRFGSANVREAMIAESSRKVGAAINSMKSKGLEALLKPAVGKSAEAAAGNFVKGAATNTAREGLLQGVFREMLAKATSPKAVAKGILIAIGSAAFTGQMASNELGDTAQGASIAMKEAAEAGNWEGVERMAAIMDAAKEMQEDWRKWIPIVGYTRAVAFKTSGAIQSGEEFRKSAELSEEKWNNLRKEEEEAEANKRAYWENVTKETEERKAEERAFFEEKAAESEKREAERRAYDAAVRAYWEGVNEEKQRQKEEDRAYWDNVNKQREKEAWNYGNSNLNFGLL